jgi:O-antigen/teichoic acid export membrane protein
MGFWLVAARLYSEVDVGRDSVLISVMIELSTVCQLNLDNGIVRFLPDLGGSSRRAVAGAYLLTGLLALVVGSVFVLAAPHLSGELDFLGEDHLLQAGFVAALIAWGVFALQDATLTATRRASWVPLENGIFGVLKLAALPLLLGASLTHSVFAAWTLPMLLLVIPINVLIFRRAIPKHLASHGGEESSLHRLGVRRVVRFLSQDYAATIFARATTTVLAILVIAILGPKASAYFAIPFMIVVAFDSLAFSACTSLVVEATLAGEQLHALSRVLVRRVFALLLPVGLVLIAAAPLILLPFGHAYQEEGTTVLRVLLCASLLRPGIALFSAVSRVRGQGTRLALLELALLTLILGAAVPLAHSHGIDGVAVAWTAANGLVVLALIPWLVRFMRTPDQVLHESELPPGSPGPGPPVF